MKSNDTITASWNGKFSPNFILENSLEIPNKSEAKKLSEYLWQEGFDSGWGNRLDCYMYIEYHRGGFDGLYKEMKQKEAENKN